MYRLPDLMKMFDIPERTIRRHLSLGILSGSKVGGSWRFSEEDVKQYLDQNQITKSQSKSATNKVFDFINGVSNLKDKTLVSLNQPIMTEAKVKELTDFVNTLSHGFYFNISPHSNLQNITFIGDFEDAIHLTRLMQNNHE
ncbi:MAG: helix-turn-helix domain-containing protein [Bacilli bacterium]|nr:helix-turn-helix domain-containing protein [Bacilli bacterium]MBN2876501.1 helix-turn-helix domain-containing protein [Bacilli bacterium]